MVPSITTITDTFTSTMTRSMMLRMNSRMLRLNTSLLRRPTGPRTTTKPSARPSATKNGLKLAEELRLSSTLLKEKLSRLS